jgi:hypothetical protein
MEIGAGRNPLARDFGTRGRSENGLMISKIDKTVIGRRVKAEKCPKRAAMDRTYRHVFRGREDEGIDVGAPAHVVVQQITPSKPPACGKHAGLEPEFAPGV